MMHLASVLAICNLSHRQAAAEACLAYAKLYKGLDHILKAHNFVRLQHGFITNLRSITHLTQASADGHPSGHHTVALLSRHP